MKEESEETVAYLLACSIDEEERDFANNDFFFVSPETLRNAALKVFNQQNFTTQNYITIMKALYILMSHSDFNPGVERKDLPLRENLNFWVDCVMFIPRLPFSSRSQVAELQLFMIQLNEELVEVDF